MKKRVNLRTEAREILTTTVVLREGQKIRELSLFGAILALQAEKALRGNERAAKIIFDVAPLCGLLHDQEEKRYALDLTKLSDDELKALERITAKSQYVDLDPDEDEE